MSEKVSIEQKIQQYRQSNPKLQNLSDKQLLSIMLENGEITLTEAQQNSILSKDVNNQNNDGLIVQKNSKNQTINLKSGRKIVIKDGTTRYYAADGVELKKEYFEKQEGQIEIKQSGRYSVTKSGRTKYYAADGTELKESYFKQVESTDVKVKCSNGKTYNLNKTIEKRINNVTVNLQKAEDSNGFIGATWSGFKNLTGIGDSSDKVREQQEVEKKLLQQFNTQEQRRPELFKELTGVDYTPENLEKFIKGEIKLKSEVALQGYTEGQETAVDVGADIVAGVAAVGIYSAAVAAAPFTGGASIAVGIVAAGASGAAIKTGLKAADAAAGGREYTLNDAGHDAATGAFSGIIAPVTGGMGGAVGKTVATKLGVQAVKQAGKEVAEEAVKGGVKQTIKTALTNPTGYEYVGGNFVKRGLAFSAETATDGAVSGAVDNAFRTAYDGGSLEDIGNSAVDGFVGGAIMSPVIGGGMKAAGKAGQKVFGKDNVQIDTEANKVCVNNDGTVVRTDADSSEIPNISKSVENEEHSIIDELAIVDSKEEIVAEVYSGSNAGQIFDKDMMPLYQKYNGSQIAQEIRIPKGRMRAPRPGFDETLEAYINIIKDNTDEISEICIKYQNGIYNEIQFANAYAKILAEKMDMPYYPELKELVDNKTAGGMQNTTNTLFLNISKMERMSELMSAVMHEMHHFLQQKEIFSTISIEEFSALKAKADIMGDIKEDPHYYKTQAEINNAIEEQTRGYIEDFKNAGWEQVLRNYPKNNNPNSPYAIRSRKLLEAELEYGNGSDNIDAYFHNFLEKEAYEISVRTEIEIEYRIMHTIDLQEKNLALEIYDTLNSPTFDDVQEVQQILQSFKRNPYNIIEIVKQAKEMGLVDAYDIIESLTY